MFASAVTSRVNNAHCLTDIPDHTQNRTNTFEKYLATADEMGNLFERHGLEHHSLPTKSAKRRISRLAAICEHCLFLLACRTKDQGMTKRPEREPSLDSILLLRQYPLRDSFDHLQSVATTFRCGLGKVLGSGRCTVSMKLGEPRELYHD